jgi:hypothetical protein
LAAAPAFRSAACTAAFPTVKEFGMSQIYFPVPNISTPPASLRLCAFAFNPLVCNRARSKKDDKSILNIGE